MVEVRERREAIEAWNRAGIRLVFEDVLTVWVHVKVPDVAEASGVGVLPYHVEAAGSFVGANPCLTLVNESDWHPTAFRG